VRKITIVGAGQGGLLLGHALLARGYHVTIATKFTPEQVVQGRILSNQCMWHDALEIERAFGLALWDGECPPIPGFDTWVIGRDGKPLHRYPSPLSHPGQSVDQRLKFSHWMRLYERRGGKLLFVDVGLEELEQFAADSDLTVVATGKGRGAMQGFFERDDQNSRYRSPRRFGASLHVKHRWVDAKYSPEYEHWAIIPDVGEFWIFPTLTVHGRGHVVCVQGVPGGPLDVWSGLDSLDAHHAMMLEILQRWLPEEADRCADMRAVDSKAWLSGGVTPQVTHPIRRLDSGRHVLAIGDSYVLNDPISQQGSNNAARAAKLYFDRIVAHEDRPFDLAWMRKTAAEFWDYAKWTVRLNELYLESPPAFRKVFADAARSPALARRLADSNNSVVDFVRSLTAATVT
jgi:2-polyprenyl-6-methoxyphenol hydroxylase-like FAD-dependent oxidoreductase